MNGVVVTLRLAARAARAAPQMSIHKVAAAAGTSERELADSLRGWSEKPSQTTPTATQRHWRRSPPTMTKVCAVRWRY